MKVIKKDGTLEDYDEQKIINAVNKSANRALFNFTTEDYGIICNRTLEEIEAEDFDNEEIPVTFIHSVVEKTLLDLYSSVGLEYQQYRNYKLDFVKMLDEVYEKSQAIMYIGDKDNANTDSALVATKRSLVFNVLNKSLYQKFFLTKDELQACNDGYIYVHDMSARRDTINCCLFRMGDVMRGGFEMGNVWYNEPNSLDTAFDVMGDIILSTAAQQYGGFTVPRVDSILAPYAEKSYYKYKEEYLRNANDVCNVVLCKDNTPDWAEITDNYANNYALEKVQREFEQGWQGIEYKLNTVGSSRGDYPFVTMSFGLDTTVFGKMASITFLNVHKEGQGKSGFKRPVLFPKLVFLYDKDIHGRCCCNEDVFNAGVECSLNTMYPDWLSLTGDGYVATMYKKYGEVVSPMGCRAFLSPWYERGGMYPEDEYDKPVFEGRFNLGVVSLHLPMILAKARSESKDFYNVLDYYLEIIRELHKRTYDYIGEMKASTNPVAYCEGGFYGGHLKPSDKIKSILKPMTLSFGITALNELQELYNSKSIVDDGQFALDVMKHINEKIDEFKKEDDLLYAIYATPGESLCGLQIEQFRKKYGIIEGVSDRAYVSNSFHCGVWEDISTIQKQNSEYRFWDYFNGGKIQYCKYPINYNKEAVITLIRRAMEMGFYEGINEDLAYCEDCGYEQLDMNVCPRCKSTNITMVSRMNGYLGYTKIHGDTRYNKAKNIEINERKSM